MHRALILIPTLLLIPTDAFACMNSMYRDVTEQIATQPLEFLHFGLAIAALVLLRWRGQPRDDDRRAPEWSMSRQVAFLAVMLFGSFGAGLFASDALAITGTRLTTTACWSLGFVALGLSMSLFQTRPNFLVAVRRLSLAIALAMSLGGASNVWNGKVTYSKKMWDEPIQSEVYF